MASFLTQDRPKVEFKNHMVELYGNGKNALPEGTHYFVLGVGKTDGDAWAANDDNVDAIPFTACSIWCMDVGEQGGFLNWIYTGKEDPIADLGRDLPPAQQLPRMKEIYGDKTKFASRLPDSKYLIPMMKVDKVKKDYDLSSATPVLLIVRESMLRSILEACQSTTIADLPNAQAFGKVLEVKKDLKQAKMADYYKFTLLNPPKDLVSEIADFDDNIQMLREEGIASVQRVFDNGNLGAYDPDNVRKYIVQQTNMSYEDFVEKYSVKPKLVEVDEVMSIKF